VPKSPLNRRDFLKKSSATAAGIPLLGSSLLRAATAPGSDQLKVGLIGCGGRGTGAAMQAIQADPGVVFFAAADAFADRMENSLRAIQEHCEDEQMHEQMSIPAERRFVGLDAYKKVIELCDVVLLTTPPGFRPQHLRAAIEAGCHVFCEKPVATDAPGVRSVLETARMAREKNLSIASGFCWRAHLGKRAAYKHIHSGGIGDVRHIWASYLTGGVWHKEPKPDWSAMTQQVRNWYYYTWLGGDHIVEQAIHSIDKILWAMQDKPPLYAIGVGGRAQRTDAKYGNIWDHFSVLYEFEGGTQGHLMTRQQNQCHGENLDRVHGSKGTMMIDAWAGDFHVEHGDDWRYDGASNNMYQTEHDELFAGIRSGNHVFQAEDMAHTTLMAIMGRMACYTGRKVTWQDALNDETQLVPNQFTFDTTPPDRRFPIPGQA
jgi:predicted dehydrogenase